MNTILLNADQEGIYDNLCFGYFPYNPEDEDSQWIDFITHNEDPEYIEKVWVRVIQVFSPQLAELGVRLNWLRQDWDVWYGLGELVKWEGDEGVKNLAKKMASVFTELVGADVDAFYDKYWNEFNRLGRKEPEESVKWEINPDEETRNIEWAKSQAEIRYLGE